MKFLADFFPVLLFFVAYKVYDIYVATAVAIVACFVQVTVHWLKHRRFENMHLVTLAIMVVFGGATLFLQDEMFIKWKPTVINWVFAAVFLGSHFIGEKTIIQRMMGQAMTLPNQVWVNLNISWILFFIAIGVLNLYVVYNFDTDTWVNFKLFGLMGITFAFVILQIPFLTKYITQDDEPKKADESTTGQLKADEAKPGDSEGKS
ncbi:MAG: septation protein A [Thiotrichaceae bacterium]|nr:septation protein A [Thiotrichaceae bacterium]PCI12274.1 MAG: septation protein A [Thiotrichales bacterium]